jgi:hypothetical protein
MIISVSERGAAAVGDKPVAIAGHCADLADHATQIHRRRHCVGRAFRPLHDLEQFHHIGRGEEMRAGDVLRPLCRIGHDVDVDARRVGVEQRARLHDLVEFLEHLLLDWNALEHRLDYDVAPCDVVEALDRPIVPPCTSTAVMPPKLKNPPAVTVCNMRLLPVRNRVQLVLANAGVHRDLACTRPKHDVLVPSRSEIPVARHLHQKRLGRTRRRVAVVADDQRRLRMPLPGDAQRRARGLCRCGKYRPQFGKVGPHEIVIAAIGWWLVEEICRSNFPKPGPRMKQRQGWDCLAFGTPPLGDLPAHMD